MEGCLPGIYLSVLGGHAQEENRAGVEAACSDSPLSGTGHAGKPPGPNSDTKGQVIQRRRQQILYAPVAYLNQEEGYDEMFIITGSFMYGQ